MDDEILEFVTYYEKQKEIADRFKRIRRLKKVSQRRLSTLSGVTYASIRRFETTGDISFRSLVKLCLTMRLYEDLDNLFEVEKHYKKIADLIHDLHLENS